MTPTYRSGVDFMKRQDLWVETAHYIEPDDRKYQNNPLIAALVPEEPWEIIAEHFRNYPSYDPAICTADPMRRLNAVKDILHFFYPRLVHRDLYRITRSLMADHYLTSNPIQPTYRQSTRDRIARIKQKLPVDPIWEDIEMAMISIGLPGMGKTTGLRKALSLYPDIIVHQTYRDLQNNEHLLEFTQIPRLCVNCPDDGSTRALCVGILRVISHITGVDYVGLYVRREVTKDMLIPIIANLLVRHHVGILSIDEIQNLNRAGSGGIADMLNFFVRLISELKTPLLLTGTDRVRPILTGALQQVRRGQAYGEPAWYRLQKTDPEWTNLMSALWRYHTSRIRPGRSMRLLSMPSMKKVPGLRTTLSRSSCLHRSMRYR